MGWRVGVDPRRNAAKNGSFGEDGAVPALRNPMTGITRRSAHAARGILVIAPVNSSINSRRRI
jgi:hypothetical protein